MDPDTFEDRLIPKSLVETNKGFLVEGSVYTVLLVDDEPVQLQLPAAVEMTVTEAPEGIKGDSATNVQKSAVVESGLVVQVPLFIKPGDRIRIGTDDGSYLGRA
jgi:elongation factor P